MILHVCVCLNCQKYALTLAPFLALHLYLVVSPALGEQPLHVLGEEQVPEQQLVLGKRLFRED